MADKITTSEIEDIIKKKLKESGLSDDIIQSSVKQIKDKIMDKYNSSKPEGDTNVNNAPENNEENKTVDVDISSESPSGMEEANPELVKKEVEQDLKEKEIEDKEKELKAKEIELDQKEKELEYKPQLPEPLKELGKEQFFVFDENQISLGAEALSNCAFYLKNNPEMKSSMHSTWINKAFTKADLFIVEFKKIGELEFDPYQGTTKLIQNTTENSVTETAPNTGFEIKKTIIGDDKIQELPEEDEVDVIIREKIEKMLKSIKV
jgi:hypothetical protein